MAWDLFDYRLLFALFLVLTLMNAPDFSRRIPQLDGLRGLAILMVAVSHYAILGLQLRNGWVKDLVFTPAHVGWAGVDLFFVLSGFLIGGILLDKRGASNYFQAFYVRRACRIFPLYFAFTVVTLGNIPAWCSFSFLQNVWMAARGTFGPLVTSPTWSLAIEEQFYFTLPAIIRFVPEKYLPKAIFGGIVAAPIVRLSYFLWSAHPIVAAYVLLPCRMDSLLIGVAAAYFVRKPHFMDLLRRHQGHLWTGIELLTLACAALLLHGEETVLTRVVLYTPLALLFACILLASLVDQRLAKWLQKKWLMGLGGIAYGVYLIHVLILQTVTRIWVGKAAVLMAGVVTIAVAKLSWELFEKPIVKLGHRVAYMEGERSEEVRSLAALPSLPE